MTGSAGQASGFSYAYIHGFASSSLSKKGLFLNDRLKVYGIHVHLPDLNEPSFETMTYTSMLAVLDRLDEHVPGGRRWRLVGSSMGGYISARWAELNPARVDRLLLLCPGFDLQARWPEVIGEGAVERWKETGTHAIADGSGTLRPLAWNFHEDVRTHPMRPVVPCPTRIIHGTRDDVVPIELSRSYARERPGIEIVEVDDGHSLADSLDVVLEQAVDFFGL